MWLVYVWIYLVFAIFGFAFIFATEYYLRRLVKGGTQVESLAFGVITEDTTNVELLRMIAAFFFMLVFLLLLYWSMNDLGRVVESFRKILNIPM